MGLLLTLKLMIKNLFSPNNTEQYIYIYFSQLCRLSTEHLLRQCKYLLRKYKFQELAERDPHAAMLYLQNDLASIVDHKNLQEREEVSSLCLSALFLIVTYDK